MNIDEIISACDFVSQHWQSDEVPQLIEAVRILRECKAAGFVTAEGEVRKVLGTLPLTADGCVAEYGRTYWCWCHVPVFDGTSVGPSSWRIDVVEKTLESCDPCEEYIGDYTKYPPACYSTREAAEAARAASLPPTRDSQPPLSSKEQGKVNDKENA